MNKIEGKGKTVREVLSGVKYSIDYYQREYRWESKQMAELIRDLASQFDNCHNPDGERAGVERYSHYFLGSIITSECGGRKFIIDVLQRLTSRGLLLIYLHHGGGDWRGN
jgi:uncharacterized protein with ParB-like and HNH nuclease domain